MRAVRHPGPVDRPVHSRSVPRFDDHGDDRRNGDVLFAMLEHRTGGLRRGKLDGAVPTVPWRERLHPLDAGPARPSGGPSTQSFGRDWKDIVGGLFVLGLLYHAWRHPEAIHAIRSFFAQVMSGLGDR